MNQALLYIVIAAIVGAATVYVVPQPLKNGGFLVASIFFIVGIYYLIQALLPL